MMPMKDVFYGGTEPVWILNHNRDDGTDEEDNESGSSENSPERRDYSPPPSNHYYHYHSDGHYFAGPADDFTAETETEVVMKVPICCGECESSVRAALEDLKGVKSVKCDIYNERVTVVVTSYAPADVLAKCKKVFKKSRWWENDD